MRTLFSIASGFIVLISFGCQKATEPNQVTEAPSSAVQVANLDDSLPISENEVIPTPPAANPQVVTNDALQASTTTAKEETKPTAMPQIVAANNTDGQLSAPPAPAPAPAPATTGAPNIPQTTAVFDLCTVIGNRAPAQATDVIRVATRGLSRKPEASTAVERLAPLTGKGRSSEAKQADELALIDLQNNLVDTVRQDPKNCNATAAAVLNVCSRSNSTNKSGDELPILGARFTREKDTADSKISRVELDQQSLRFYVTQLEKERAELDDLFNSLQTKANSGSIETKRKVVVHLQRYLGLAVVTAALGERTYLQQTDSIDRILNEIASYQDAKSIDDAAAMIAGTLGRDKTQAYPARQFDAFEITPFAAALFDKLQMKLAKRSAPSIDNAIYLLTGNYKICGNGDMVVHYDLTDKNHLVIDTLALKIGKEVYSSYRTTPTTTDLDRSFLQKTSADRGFRADITTNRGNRDLLIREGESVQFYARLTEPGYFFVIGHVMQQDGKRFSYLVELNKDPNNKFVVFVPPDQANQYIDLGEYEMGAPFGTEYMQLLASTQNPAETIPVTRWNADLELHVIEQSGSSPKDVVERVRAAKKVKKQSNIRTHEGVLTYTTIPK